MQQYKKNYSLLIYNPFFAFIVGKCSCSFYIQNIKIMNCINGRRIQNLVVITSAYGCTLLNYFELIRPPCIIILRNVHQCVIRQYVKYFVILMLG